MIYPLLVHILNQQLDRPRGNWWRILSANRRSMILIQQPDVHMCIDQHYSRLHRPNRTVSPVLCAIKRFAALTVRFDFGRVQFWDAVPVLETS